MDFASVLRIFGDFFERERIRYAVIGGIAVTAWGRVRSTKDLDFAVEADGKLRVITFAESIGYETLFASESFSNHLHADPSFGRVDFMYLRGTTAEQVFSATTEKSLLSDHSLPVASAEHLAMMKGLSMRNDSRRIRYEGEDVRVLLNVDGVNIEAVREYYRSLGMLEFIDAIIKAR
ncbi:MAG: hypothetical protein QOC81_2111 [Thermoanaerobaculia bacterium]|jgi:hypothetical protein|nr:hypothetical protein [Thermoanaerobaculia bacterium]